MPALLAALGSFASSLFGSAISRFIAYKALAVVLITVTLPIVLQNFLWWFVDIVFTFVNSLVPAGTFSGAVLQYTGLAAYFATHLRFTDCLTVIITALTIKMVLNFIPGY